MKGDKTFSLARIFISLGLRGWSVSQGEPFKVFEVKSSVVGVMF